MMSQFFDSHYGVASAIDLRDPIARLKDLVLDTHLRTSRRLRQIVKQSAATPRLRILLVSVEVPGREQQLAEVIRGLTESRHEVDVSITPMKPQGKFANINDAIGAAPRTLGAYDWLVVTDDDISFDSGFMDRYLAVATAAELAISMPAHRFASHASFYFTRRRPHSLARNSRFVEIGPITFLKAETFADLIPFPPSRWCYGIDVIWSATAERRGWKMGIVDAAPVAHLKPIAATYSLSEAMSEGASLLAAHDLADVKREDLLTASISLPV
jgi:Glycosyltransferase like family 2